MQKIWSKSVISALWSAESNLQRHIEGSHRALYFQSRSQRNIVQQCTTSHSPSNIDFNLPGLPLVPLQPTVHEDYCCFLAPDGDDLLVWIISCDFLFLKLFFNLGASCKTLVRAAHHQTKSIPMIRINSPGIVLHLLHLRHNQAPLHLVLPQKALP